MFNAKAFGESVNQCRREEMECVCGKPLGIRDAAHDIGISSATLSRVERGNAPSIEVFAKICKWMNASTDAWLGQMEGITP